jgi:SecD/SecF fusion protein
VRRYLLILLLLVVALAGVAVLALFRQPTLGLDLQGGLGIVLQAEAPKGQQVNDEGMERSIEIIRSRIDKLGVAEPEIRQQGTNQILIELPGIRDARRAAELVGTTARLEFYDLEEDVTGASEGPPQQPVVENTSVLPLLAPAGRVRPNQDPSTWTRVEAGEEPTAWYLFSADKKKRLAGPAETSEELLADLEGEPPNGARFYVVPDGRIVLTCSAETARVCPGGDVLQTGGSFEPAPDTTYYYLFEYKPDDANEPIPELTGDDLRLRGTQQDFDGSEPIVTLEFTGEGGDKFHDITRELANRGRQMATLLGVPTDDRDLRQPALQSFAIVLDGEVRSFPTIDFVGDTAQGIAGGRAQITGLDDVQEAKDLALVLQTGALPYSFERQALTEISATLGEDSLREAYIAGLIGLALVVVFLLLVYRFLGVVAIIGLGIYGVFLYGLILAFGVTLTLPGFAGLILTIGVAADANIVIFERIKEEVRAGKSVRAAIANGYRKGFNTIVDGNVVTMITAAVLFLIATGGVRGFALMLLIGTLMSMVTAVLATRALLGVLARFRWFDNPAFMGASAERIPDWQKRDFVGRRRIWFAVSAVVILIGAVSLGVQGLNLGIDFEGGSQATFQTPEPVSIERVRAEATAAGETDAVIQGRGEEVRGGYADFSLKTESPIDDQYRRDDGLGELQRADPPRRGHCDCRLAHPDRPLRLLPLPVRLLGARPRRDGPRRPRRDRCVLTLGAGGDGRERRGAPHDPRVLDLRHDHHLRPRARERGADAPLELHGDREPVALGDDPPLARDDLYRAPPGRVPLRVRRRDAQGLRLRDPDRRRVGRLLDDLHRDAAPRRPEGAGPRVREA